MYRPRRSPEAWLLCTRNFKSCYGVDLVVRAFAEIKKSFPGARLVLVGREPWKKEIRRLVNELGTPDVEFAGPIAPGRMAEFYAAASVSVNASWIDNMPVSILECFASGLPVITTSAGGIPYLVQHQRTGLLCEAGDWRSLASNVVRVLSDKALALNLAQNGFEQSLQYRWELVRTDWLNVYQSLIAASTPIREG